MPPDPPTTLCILYICGLVLGLLSDVLQATNARRPGNEASAHTDNCVLRTPHQSTLYMYAPSSSISKSAPGLQACYFAKPSHCLSTPYGNSIQSISSSSMVQPIAHSNFFLNSFYFSLVLDRGIVYLQTLVLFLPYLLLNMLL